MFNKDLSYYFSIGLVMVAHTRKISAQEPELERLLPLQIKHVVHSEFLNNQGYKTLSQTKFKLEMVFST